MRSLLAGLAGVVCSMLVMTLGAIAFAAQHPGGLAAFA